VPGWPEVKLLRRQRAVAIVLTECAKLAIPKEEFNKLHSENYTKNFHLCIHSPVDDARASRKEIHDIPTAKKIVVFQYRKSGTRCQNPILIYRSSSQQLPFIIPTPVPFGTVLHPQTQNWVWCLSSPFHPCLPLPAPVSPPWGSLQ